MSQEKCTHTIEPISMMSEGTRDFIESVFGKEKAHITPSGEKVQVVLGDTAGFRSSYGTQIDRRDIDALIQPKLLPAIDQAMDYLGQSRRTLYNITKHIEPENCELHNFLKEPALFPYKFIFMDGLDGELSFFGEYKGYEVIGIHPEFFITSDTHEFQEKLNHEFAHILDRRDKASNSIVRNYLPYIESVQQKVRGNSERSYRISNEEILVRLMTYAGYPEDERMNSLEYWNYIIDLSPYDGTEYMRMKGAFDIGGRSADRNNIIRELSLAPMYRQIEELIQVLRGGVRL